MVHTLILACLTLLSLRVNGSLSSFQNTSAFSWADTKYWFSFGDSYTTTGYNVSAGILSPSPGFTSSNGLNWVEYLNGTYNVTDLSVFNLAYGGATIDNSVITPYLPTVESIKAQTALFIENFSPPPPEASWSPSNTLISVFEGINDVGNSYYWTNVSLPAFYNQVMDEYFGLMTQIYEAGARNFLFLTVPPLHRTPLFTSQGAVVLDQVTAATALYNKALINYAAAFSTLHHDLRYAVFDTGDVFNLILDNGPVFGFQNTTGFCEGYVNGTPQPNTFNGTFCEGLPVSSYMWLNSLHPTWPVHNILAHSIANFLL